MNLKKICSFIVVGLLAIMFIPKVSAASGTTLSCQKTDLTIGESTTCTVYVTYEYSDSNNAPAAASITLSTNQYLKVSDVTANSTLGWAASPANDTGSTYAFNKTSGATITSGQRFELMSFKITLDQSAKNLGENDTCGDLCISGATINSLTISSYDKGSCYLPTVTTEECTGPKCNAETGAFLNYTLIALGVAVAVVAILVARRSNKFYRV